MSYFVKNSQANDYAVRSQRLCVPLKVTHAAGTAQVYTNDLPACMVIAGEAQTATAAAIDSGTNFTTPVAANGIIGVLIYNLGTVAKLLNCTLFNLSSGTCTVTAVGASSTGVTASGNIAVSLDSSLDFTATDLTTTMCVDYIIAKA